MKLVVLVIIGLVAFAFGMYGWQHAVRHKENKRFFLSVDLHQAQFAQMHRRVYRATRKQMIINIVSSILLSVCFALILVYW